jgi:hypothetical protein
VARRSSKSARSDAASGDAVANSSSANSRGVLEEAEKSIEEKKTPPEETSGTPERVLIPGLQVTEFWIEVTVSWTSAGRGVVPTMKQAWA